MGRSYRDLIAWQKGMDLVKRIYKATRTFPREEVYGLTSQLRRAAVSIPSNIAEGQARQSPREFKYFLTHARGSIMEVETQLLIAQDLQYISPAEAESLLSSLTELGRILNGLLGSIKAEG